MYMKRFFGRSAMRRLKQGQVSARVARHIHGAQEVVRAVPDPTLRAEFDPILADLEGLQARVLRTMWPSEYDNSPEHGHEESSG